MPKIDKEAKASLERQRVLRAQSIKTLIWEYTEWVKAHVDWFSPYDEGDELFDLRTGKHLGIVVRNYVSSGDWGNGYQVPIDFEIETPQGEILRTSEGRMRPNSLVPSRDEVGTFEEAMQRQAHLARHREIREAAQTEGNA